MYVALHVGRLALSGFLSSGSELPDDVFDFDELVVNCADNGQVLLVEAGTLSLAHRIPVGTMPIGIAVPDDDVAYAANMGDDTISAIDIRRGLSYGRFRPATTRMASCFFPVDRRLVILVANGRASTRGCQLAGSEALDERRFDQRSGFEISVVLIRCNDLELVDLSFARRTESLRACR
jgi:hypothetical protein